MDARAALDSSGQAATISASAPHLAPLFSELSFDFH
jgi:hypothetical protein